jgi:nitroimidazol reductase NimA-like FMN-containing flavoprotein (pyridoxamine 5'-phosphate oxidase superfamily)
MRHIVRRAADRAHYDQDTIHRIIDAAYVCHVSWSAGGQVLCIPTACWRMGDHLYIHGSNGSRMMQNLADGAQACVAITLLDGLVLAKSAFSHSMNYRSVVIHGQFEVVSDEDKPSDRNKHVPPTPANCKPPPCWPCHCKRLPPKSVTGAPKTKRAIKTGLAGLGCCPCNCEHCRRRPRV